MKSSSEKGFHSEALTLIWIDTGLAKVPNCLFTKILLRPIDQCIKLLFLAAHTWPSGQHLSADFSALFRFFWERCPEQWIVTSFPGTVPSFHQVTLLSCALVWPPCQNTRKLCDFRGPWEQFRNSVYPHLGAALHDRSGAKFLKDLFNVCQDAAFISNLQVLRCGGCWLLSSSCVKTALSWLTSHKTGYPWPAHLALEEYKLFSQCFFLFFFFLPSSIEEKIGHIRKRKNSVSYFMPSFLKYHRHYLQDSMNNIALQAGLTQNCSVRMFVGKAVCSKWAMTQAVALQIGVLPHRRRGRLQQHFTTGVVLQ